MELPIQLLTQLADVLRQPSRPRPFPTKLWQRLVSQGWVIRHELEDLMLAMDGRLYAFPVDDLAQYLGFPSRDVCHKPRFPTSDVVLFSMWSTRDVAGFAITLEQLGFSVDPGPMVATFADQVAAAPLLTTAELDIHTYAAQKGRLCRELEADGGSEEIPNDSAWRSADGYRYRAVTRGGEVIALTVTGPKYRAPRRQEVTCAVCKQSYTQGDRESALAHRAEHARVVRLLHPRSSQRMRERLAQGRAAAERVDVHAPMWMHREVYDRAMRFKRDFGYDWPQWHEAKRREQIDPKWLGFVFVDDSGAIDGACSFAREEDGWTLCWVWIRPSRRRHGLLAARWPSFLAEFGHFWIEHPLSDSMTRFIARHGSPEQLRRIAETYPAGHPIAHPLERAV